jgi:hypothetical protein
LRFLCFGQTKPEKHCEPPRHALPDGSERGLIAMRLEKRNREKKGRDTAQRGASTIII